MPLLSGSADAMFYGLQSHPSYQAVHSLTNQMMYTSQLPALQYHEVDGAYANERLNARYLSIPGFNGCSGGFFFKHSRCQNHATHLITVAILNLVGFNALSKLYQLTVFLSNLGYVLRLQLAVRDWLVENLVVIPTCDVSDATSTPDPLMAELKKYIQMWHNSTASEETDGDRLSSKRAQFEKKLSDFADMWNARASGPPS